MDDTQFTHYILCNSYLREVVDGVCYQSPIGNNLFVITNKNKVVYIGLSQTPCRWEPFHGIGVMECCIMYVVVHTVAVHQIAIYENTREEACLRSSTTNVDFNSL